MKGATMYVEMTMGESVLLAGRLEVIDQNGAKVEDPEIVDAARSVYDAASDLINDLLIPGLNDVLYAERTFPLKNPEAYENHGYSMMRAAYIVAAYFGLGKVKGRNLIVYPTAPIETVEEGYYGIPIIRMHVRIEKL